MIRISDVSKSSDHLKIQALKDFTSARRVVIKVGTNTVTAPGGGFNYPRMRPLVRTMAEQHQAGRQVVLVSSGAVGLGAAKLGVTPTRLHNLTMRQACAAAGQSLLMNSYERLFGRFSVKIGQVLLTEMDFSNWQRYFSLRGTMEKLLKLGVLPIVNENDTVSTAELEYVDIKENSRRVFSDNDHLAALITVRLDADALIMLTNVDGLMPAPPDESYALESTDSVIPLITEVSSDLKLLARGSSINGRGGMRTKLEAAEIVMRNGALAVIANGGKHDGLQKIFAGDQIGTCFVPTTRLKGKRRWIAHAAEVRGRIIVNQGAREAIVERKASLLATGVIRFEQDFEAKDVVSIADPQGREIARGLINFGRREAEDLIRLTTADKKKLDVLVTRNNIVLLEPT